MIKVPWHDCRVCQVKIITQKYEHFVGSESNTIQTNSASRYTLLNFWREDRSFYSYVL
jgi:hypothetical protein